MSGTRDIQSNRLCSLLITWGPVIGSGYKIACNRGQQSDLTGDARLEFLRISARRLKMRERIERAG